MVHARHDRMHVVPGVSLEAAAAGVRWLQVLDGGTVAICSIRRPQMDRYERLCSSPAIDQPTGLPDRTLFGCRLHAWFPGAADGYRWHAVRPASLARPLSSSERVAMAVHFPHFRAGVPCAQ